MDVLGSNQCATHAVKKKNTKKATQEKGEWKDEQTGEGRRKNPSAKDAKKRRGNTGNTLCFRTQKAYIT